jgi:glycosyltransferase involved in cell wall biosynthesis
MRIGLISHTNFLGNSAMHVFNLAVELIALGHEVVVLVPDSPETVEQYRPASFPIVDYPTALKVGLPFEGGAPPDLLHAWTPRDHVRIITEALAEKYDCRYYVHMEDNEQQIIDDEIGGLKYAELLALPDDVIDSMITPYRSHPRRSVDFMEGAAGYSCLIDRLQEFCPTGLPSVTFWAGFEAEFVNIGAEAKKQRERFGLKQDEIVVFYGGNVHFSIARDIRDLYLAVALLRRRGLNIRLLRTGWNYAPLDLPDDKALQDAFLDLGFVDRADMSVLVGLSDILVQPGKSDLFNDYRFPSKLPEYLVSGKPVILPNSNVGLELTDGTHCLKLYDGGLVELAATIEKAAADSALAARIGANGRAFALKHLQWSLAGSKLDNLYRAPVARRERKGAAPATGDANLVKLIAYYLPQFHPIPENDEWWGKGFTEWTNVSRARPQFPEHYQPRLPTDLGHYDLRVPEVMHEQVALARKYAVSGFCFYYYWFNGRRVLEKPLDNWLAPGAPDFPFCICWANENWSRRWDGSENELLLEQKYNEGFEQEFIDDIAPILKDARYIRVDGAPLLQIYRVTEFKDPVGSAAALRRAAAGHGIEKLHLCVVQSFGISDPRPYGFDSAVEFSPPHVDRLLLDPKRMGGVLDTFEGYMEDYVGVAAQSINHPPTDYTRYRGCFPTWDNTARRKSRGHIFVNESPKAYANWLRFLVHEALVRRDDVEPLIFINAWNEWAEGTYLEPDERYGHGLLETTYAAWRQGIVDYAIGKSAHQERVFTAMAAILPSPLA